MALVPGVLERGVQWLVGYQAEQVRRLQLPKTAPYHKEKADALDAFVYMVLADEQAFNKAGKELHNTDMKAFLLRGQERPAGLRQGDVRPGPAPARRQG